MMQTSACVAFVASVAISAAAASANGIFSASQYWRSVSPDDFKRYTLARVYDTKGFAEANFHGNAFVVDADLGLLLTAYHVAKEATSSNFPRGEKLVLSFPSLSNGKKLQAEVVELLGQEGGSTEAPRDLALLRISDVIPPQLVSARIALSEIQPEEATLYSYLAPMILADHKTGSLSQTYLETDNETFSECTLNFDLGPGHGESGAPVTIDGYVVGMMLHFRSFGGRSLGEVMPLHCAREKLMDWAAGANADIISNHVQTFLSSDKESLSLSLTTDGPDDRISNFLISGSIGTILDRSSADSDKSLSPDELERLSENLACPIYAALGARRIPLRGEEFAMVFTRSKTRTEIKQVGDEFLRKAQQQAQLSPDISIAVGSIATELYEVALGSLYSEQSFHVDLSSSQFSVAAASGDGPGFLFA